MFTAISAARHGARVALMHDRPVLGGNASSEIRMWISGAGTRVRDLQETGIMEELQLENMYRNPKRNWSTWDALLYEKVRFEPNIDLILNCTCNDAKMENGKIKSVKGFQLTTYTWHEVEAKIFVDSSGDSILAPLTGAEYRVGREAKSEHGEEFGLEVADRHTMGMSILLQCRQTDHPVEYTPPAWAYDFPDDEAMNNKPHNIYAINTNFYWIELGGMQNSIDDTEEVRDELLKIAFGVWDHMKNHGDHGAENWELEWVGFLPGKRESRRYVGDYVLTQHDVENCPRFDDTVAYGGWQIDNHLPGGFHMNAKDGGHLQKRRLTEPYGIPFRSLYSKNIDNLMFAGRNISATHIAFSTTRVMGTCGVMGQAVGTAVSVAIKNGMLPREVGQKKISEIQQILMEDDCWLPGMRREISRACRQAQLVCQGQDKENLRNGVDRPTDEAGDNGCYVPLGTDVTYLLAEPTFVERLRIVFDSDLDRDTLTGGIPEIRDCPTVCNRPMHMPGYTFPATMTRGFVVLADGEEIFHTQENYRRLVRIPVERQVHSLTLRPLTTWGSETAHIFSLDF